MNLIELKVFTNGKEIAQGKTATMSSTWDAQNSHPASFLVDGNPKTMAHTSGKDVPWMMVDLGAEYPIDHIIIINRQDCCTGRLIGAELDILNASQKTVFTSQIF